METSTPIAARRESQQIDLGEESPIGGEGSNSLETPDISDERIQDSKNKAGLSNEMDSMNVTLPKEVSPNTMDKRLALHCADIA